MNSLNEQTVRINQWYNLHIGSSLPFFSFTELPKIAEALQECHEIVRRKQIPNVAALPENYTATSYSKDSDGS